MTTDMPDLILRSTATTMPLHGRPNPRFLISRNFWGALGCACWAV
jgi:hypothetical protein